MCTPDARATRPERSWTRVSVPTWRVRTRSIRARGRLKRRSHVEGSLAPTPPSTPRRLDAAGRVSRPTRCARARNESHACTRRASSRRLDGAGRISLRTRDALRSHVEATLTRATAAPRHLEAVPCSRYGRSAVRRAACDFFRAAAFRWSAPRAAARSISCTSWRCSAAISSAEPPTTARSSRRVSVLIVER
jgi:hypothetical protein